MKRILLINNGYPSKTNPNYVTYIQTIEECLRAAGFEVDLLVLDSNFKTFTGKYLNFFTYYLKMLFFKGYAEYQYIYINNYPYSFLPLVPHFAKMKNVIIHWHGDDIFPGSWFSKILNKISYKFIRNHFIHFAPSNYFAVESAKKLKLDYKKIHISPSGGVDTTIFKREANSRASTGKVRLGFASGLLKAKGMDLVIKLLEARDQLESITKEKIEFHFIEYGKESKHYTNLLSAMPNIIKHSRYPINRMVDFYSNIDILLFPSLRQAESLGLVVIEAMACDVPVVATDNFALKDLVINGLAGERFVMDDYLSFREAVTKCITNLSSYEPRGFVMKNFSRQAVIEDYKIQLK